MMDYACECVMRLGMYVSLILGIHEFAEGFAGLVSGLGGSNEILAALLLLVVFVCCSIGVSELTRRHAVSLITETRRDRFHRAVDRPIRRETTEDIESLQTQAEWYEQGFEFVPPAKQPADAATDVQTPQLSIFWPNGGEGRNAGSTAAGTGSTDGPEDTDQRDDPTIDRTCPDPLWPLDGSS